MKLGTIGYGNMAGAIISGLIEKQLLPATSVVVFEHMPEKRALAETKGFTVARDEADLATQADYILLAVKPKDYPAVLKSIKPYLNSEKTLISIAAGISIEQIESTLQSDVAVVRAMPNTPLLLGTGTTAICCNSRTTEIAFAFAKQIFACAGTVYSLPETEFNQVINLNGSSPAYIYLFTKTAVEYAQKNSNIPYNIALSMFCDTLKGSAEMLTGTGKSPDELIDMVSSPGGTTVAALQAFKENGFVESLESGFAACVKRAEELGQG